MRAFLGIEVTEDVRRALADAQKALARSGADVKWVAPENIHVTLKFFGEIGDEQAAQIRAAMAEAAQGGAFTFAVEGLGSFPPRGRPRVIWAGVSAGADSVSRLQARIETACEPLGFKKERDFVPHLTIGRARSPRGAEQLMATIERRAGTAFGACPAADIVLFESTLTPRGAIYRAVARQAL